MPLEFICLNHRIRWKLARLIRVEITILHGAERTDAVFGPDERDFA